MRKVMIYGTGTMGTGIAQVLAAAGVEVMLVSARGGTDLAAKGKARVGSVLDRAVQKGKETVENAKSIMDRIHPVADMADGISQADLFLEVAAEDMELKKGVFRKAESLDPGQETLFATNSSALSITELATATKRPDRFLGIHFFNPAPVMGLVEIVKGAATDEAVVGKVAVFIESLGKSPIVVNEAPGFVVNRILVPMINEAVYALMEGVASAEDIDKGMKLGANHPIGPLALADLIGLDVCLSVMETLHREFGDPRYRPCPLLRKYVRAGFLGRKTKRGFFVYE
ncbi:MAG: 3-hydroxyacyl-CoA dehydrogenase NAD-binding domain-containing protein [Thermovirgaceae bacterium]|nr:3-hydroxyacyl-CoA dehydrogenase NAD-binding domain-containing protein [Thermovirgaceae bacterium]